MKSYFFFSKLLKTRFYCPLPESLPYSVRKLIISNLNQFRSFVQTSCLRCFTEAMVHFISFSSTDDNKARSHQSANQYTFNFRYNPWYISTARDVVVIAKRMDWIRGWCSDKSVDFLLKESTQSDKREAQCENCEKVLGIYKTVFNHNTKDSRLSLSFSRFIDIMR